MLLIITREASVEYRKGFSSRCPCIMSLLSVSSSFHHRYQQMSNDRASTAPQFTSFPQSTASADSHVAGPSRRPPPTFSSFPVPATSDQTLKRGRDGRPEEHDRHRKHRSQHRYLDYDSGARSHKSGAGSRESGHSAERRKDHHHHVSRKKSGSELVDSLDHIDDILNTRYRPYQHDATDAVRVFRCKRPSVRLTLLL